MAEEEDNSLLHSSMSQKSMPSLQDPETKDSIEKILVGPAKFTIPDTREGDTSMHHHYDEKDYTSHRKEQLRVHHPLRPLTRKSSKTSLKLYNQPASGLPEPITTPSSSGLVRPTSLSIHDLPSTGATSPVRLASSFKDKDQATQSKHHHIPPKPRSKGNLDHVQVGRQVYSATKIAPVSEVLVTNIDEVTPKKEKETPKKVIRFTIGDENEGETHSSPQESPQLPSQETPKETPVQKIPQEQQPTQETPIEVLTHQDVHRKHPHHRKDKAHHHHHHHHHRGRKGHSMGDLFSRTRRGSEIKLDGLAQPQMPTELEEAGTLNTSDLRDIAEHRLSDAHGHRPRMRGRVNSIIHVARSRRASCSSVEPRVNFMKVIEQESKNKKEKKSKKKTAIQKQYDHRPHEAFVELDELFAVEGHEMQWKEKARWIKYEEDLEEGAGRWGKPHVASLTFHSLVELRKCLEQGSVLMDLEEWALSEIFHRIADSFIISDQIPEEFRGDILRALLIKHKHVNEKQGILRNVSQMSLSSLAKSPSDGNFKPGFFKNLSSPISPNPSNEKFLKKASNDSMGFYKQLPHTNIENEKLDDVRIPMLPIENNSTPTDSADSSKKNRRSGVATKTQLPLPSTTKQTLSAEKEHIHKLQSSSSSQKSTQQKVIPGILKHTETQPKSTKQKLEGIMRKIPVDAEATTVLVGEMSCLKKPAVCFVRLAKGTILNGLTEVPIPVRFLFVLFGPGGERVDYHEIGRCFSTLMSNEHFHATAYRAESMQDLMSAMNEFIDDSMVLPAGNWDNDLLLPILRLQNKKMKERWQLVQDLTVEEDQQALLDYTDGGGFNKVKQRYVSGLKTTKKAKHINPLQRTGIPFGGLINDVKRRYPHFVSDFRDALNTQCLAAVFFIFFAAMSPVITFGGVLGERTDHYMGISEMLLGSAICGIVFALFSGQPITIIGVTGPILVFEETLYLFCKNQEVEYLPFRFWVGIWIFLITIVTVALEASVLVRYFTRFTEEVFAFLIAIIFMKEVFKKMYKIYVYHPLLNDYCHEEYDNHTTTESMWNMNTTSWEEITVYETVYETVTELLTDTLETMTKSSTTSAFMPTDHIPYKCVSIPKPKKHQPNTALLSTILMLGTFFLAWFFKMFRSSKFLGKKGRQMIGDFGTSIAIMTMVGVDLGIKSVYTEKIYIPDGFTPTDTCKRGWLVNPLGTEKTFHIGWIFAAAIPGFLAFILMYMETVIDGLIVDNPKNKLKKGSGFHLDLFLLGGLAACNGLLGLPWVWAATVRSVTHLNSLTVWSKTHAPGEKPTLLKVKEQRVTALLVNILIGISIALAPLINMIPISVLFGVFLYMGVSSLNGIQMVDRCILLAMPPKHHPDAQYVRGVRTWRMHMYTLIQLLCVAILAVIKSTKTAISFPFFLILLVPARQLLNRVFSKQELEALDSQDGEDDDDEFQEAHMPV